MSTPNKRPYSKSTRRQQPTHFLAVPLHTNSILRSRITAFQTNLFQPGAHPDGTRKTPIRGLDKSIVIDPMRFHLTLGVMALDEEAGVDEQQEKTRPVDPPHPNAPTLGTLHPSPSPAPTSPPLAERQEPPQPPPKGAPHPFTSPTRTSPPVAERQNSPQPPPPDTLHPSSTPELDTTGNADPPQPNPPPPGPPNRSTSPPPTSPPPKPPQPSRTVTTALALLRSLGPQIDAILGGGTPGPSTPGTSATTVAPELASKLELRVTLDSLDIMRPVKLKRPKPPRPRKLPQTSTSETNDPPPVMDSSDVGQETAAAGGEVGQPTGPVAGNDEEGGMGGPSVVAGVDVVRGPDRDDVWAEVMYLAPRETGEDGQKLRRIADLVNMTFRREGYVVERRALKLHCTLLNTSKRRPARTRGQPFSYSDLLRSDALSVLTAPPAPPDPHVVAQTTLTETSTSTSANPIFTSTSTTTTATLKPRDSTSRKAPPPVSIDFGPDQNDDMVVRVKELGLWVMGSRGPRGEYVSCGGVRFGEAGGM